MSNICQKRVYFGISGTVPTYGTAPVPTYGTQRLRRFVGRYCRLVFEWNWLICYLLICEQKLLFCVWINLIDFIASVLVDIVAFVAWHKTSWAFAKQAPTHPQIAEAQRSCPFSQSIEIWVLYCVVLWIWSFRTLLLGMETSLLSIEYRRTQTQPKHAVPDVKWVDIKIN